MFVAGKVRVSNRLFFELNVDVDMILTLFFFSNKIQALIEIRKKGDLRPQGVSEGEWALRVETKNRKALDISALPPNFFYGWLGKKSSRNYIL